MRLSSQFFRLNVKRLEALTAYKTLVKRAYEKTKMPAFNIVNEMF